MTHGPYFFLLLLLLSLLALKSIDTHQRAVHFFAGFWKKALQRTQKQCVWNDGFPFIDISVFFYLCSYAIYYTAS